MKQYRLAVVLEFDDEFPDGPKLAEPERVTKWLKGSLRSLAAVERKKLLYGPEPWRYTGENPDALACCSGHECGCDGETVRENFESRRAAKGFRGRVVGFEVQERDVTRWLPVAAAGTEGA